MCENCGAPTPNRPNSRFCMAPQCRRVHHGERAKRYQRAYAAKHGRSHSHRNDTPTARRPCSLCGSPLRGTWKDEPVCRGCRGQHPERSRSRRHAAARRKLAKAAKGTRSTWVWAQGTCRKCGESFVRHGTPSSFCGSGCSRSDRAVRRAREREGIRLTDARRLEVHERYGWTCYLCGLPANREATRADWDRAVVDHIVALARGGANHPDNWATAHHLCNSQKRDLSLEEFWQRYPLKKVHARLVLELAQVAS